MNDITIFNSPHWGMCRNLSNVACKWVQAPWRHPSWTARQFWDDSSYTTTIPAECCDGSFLKYPTQTPSGQYSALMILTTDIPLMIFAGQAWSPHGYAASYYLANSASSVPTEVEIETHLESIEVIDTASISKYAIILESSVIQYTSEILVPELIQLPYHYEISSSISHDLGYTDQVTLSGRVSRLRTTPPTINLQWDYTVNSNTANEISQLLTKSCNLDYSVEIAWDELEEPSSNPIKLIVGRGPTLTQRDRNNWSFSIQGRLGQ